MEKDLIQETTYSQNPNTYDRIDANDTSVTKVNRSYNIVWLIIGIIEALLIFRFVFELLGANQYNGFVQFIYTLSYPFAVPFQDIFHISAVSYSILDWSLLVAMVVYLVIGYGINQLLKVIFPTTPHMQHKLHTQDY